MCRVTSYYSCANMRERTAAHTLTHDSPGLWMCVTVSSNPKREKWESRAEGADLSPARLSSLCQMEGAGHWASCHHTLNREEGSCGRQRRDIQNITHLVLIIQVKKSPTILWFLSCSLSESYSCSLSFSLSLCLSLYLSLSFPSSRSDKSELSNAIGKPFNEIFHLCLPCSYTLMDLFSS